MSTTPPRFWYLLSEILVTLAPFRGEKPGLEEKTSLGDIRRKVLALLWQLDAVLRDDLAERDAYLVLFALVAHSDEIAQLYVQQVRQQGWEPIQLQLFKLDNAGDLFFENIDSFLYRNDIAPIVFEVYFFCLNDGFQGKYASLNDHLGEYLLNLRSRITTAVVSTNEYIRAKPPINRYRMPIWSYYGVGLALVLIAHYILVTSAKSLDFYLN